MSLFEGGVSWEVPDCVLSLAYSKRDGTGGWYDKLPDGSEAFAKSGNKVTAILAPQVLTVDGIVNVCIVMQDANTLDQISTFPITVIVEPNPSASGEPSSDYYNYSTMAEVNQVIDVFIDKVESYHRYRGNVVELGYTRFADCKKSGYYSFTATDLPSISDIPSEISAGGILIVEPKSATGVVFQTIKTSIGEIWFRWAERAFQRIVPNVDSNKMAVYRGNVVDCGYTSFESCKLPGYYSFTKDNLDTINDAPAALSSGGTLEVRPYSATNQVFQHITDVNGQVWFRYGSNEFTKGGVDAEIRWLALGDSITEGYNSFFEDKVGTLGYSPASGWASLVAKINGWELTNCGIGGTGYVSQNPSTGNDKQNAREVVESLVSTNAFQNADLVTLAYGVNDWKYDLPLGSMEDSVETGGTLYSNMRWCIHKIIENNPNIKIVVISPINCALFGNAESNYGSGYSFQNSGTLEDVFEAERKICAHYGLEFIDLLHGSVVNKLNITSTLPDGVHPSLDCHKALAYELGRKIMTRCATNSCLEADSLSIEPASRLKGHSWSILGDSLSHNDAYVQTQYWDFINSRVGGMELHHYGLDGNRITQMAVRYSKMEYSDIITVFGGVNDWGQADPTPIGTIADSDTSTFYGALNVLCSGLQTNFPMSLVIFITPLGNNGVGSFPTNENELGLSIYDYANAVKEVCAKHKIPVIDACSESMLNPQIKKLKSLYFVDGLHLNVLGHEVLSYLIENEMLRHYIPSITGQTDEQETATNTIDISATFKKSDGAGMNHLMLLVENATSGVPSTIQVEGNVGAIDYLQINANETPGVWRYDSVDNFSRGVSVGSAGKIGRITLAKTHFMDTISDVSVSESYFGVLIPFKGDSYPYSVNLSDVAVHVNHVSVPIVSVGTYGNNSAGAIADIEWG
ncbi:MAG: SGNH/GDSL hydrolase family protein [Bacteroidales bacterium]|nr:SGNH/GDSL hydrolase family protein [Bacteroidales bacterium]